MRPDLHLGKYFNRAQRSRVLVPAAYLEKYSYALSLKSLISTIIYILLTVFLAFIHFLLHTVFYLW